MLGTGIIPPLITPLLDQDKLDHDSLAGIIEHVVAGGVSGIFVLGTTGEGPSLAPAIREQVIRETCRVAGGRVPVLAAISDTSFGESVRLSAVAADAGAAAAVVAPPYYLRFTQGDLQEYVRRLCGAVPLPIFLYNIPQLTKVAFEVETVTRAAEDVKIAGIKDSSGDLAYLKRVIHATKSRGDFRVMIGPEEILADGMRLGCSGGVTGGANLQPRLFVKMYEAAARGDWAEADRLQEHSRRMSKDLYTHGDSGVSYLKGIKCALAAAGLCRNVMALPLAPFSGEDERVIRTRAANYLSDITGSGA
jgi:4-hydroxy-tetrahydrodipicolinate synthase